MSLMQPHLETIDAILHSGDMKTQVGFDAVKAELREISPWLGEFDFLGGIDVLYIEVPSDYCPTGLRNCAKRMVELAILWPYGELCIALTCQGETGHLGRITVRGQRAWWKGRDDDVVSVLMCCLTEHNKSKKIGRAHV